MRTETTQPGIAAPRHRTPVPLAAAADERVLRVALCLDSLDVGGTELNAVRTAEQLRHRGVDPLLLVLRAEGPLLERCRDRGIAVEPFPIPPIGSARSFGRAIALAQRLRELKLDLVHTQDRYTNTFVVPCARAAGVRVLASRRWWDVQPSRGLEIGNRVAYRLAHRVVANSGRVAALLSDVDGVDATKVVVIPNFLDDAALRPVDPAEQRALRIRLDVPLDALVIGCVANLRPVKDHATLLDAFARVAAAVPRSVLCLIGDGDLRATLAAQADALGIGGRVRFAGTRTDALNWHGAFDVSVLSSLHEGFPNTVVEAMAAARAVVATNVGGTPDAVRHGTSGLLVPARNPAALAAALERLLGDPNYCAALGLAGREDAARRFSADVVLPALTALYRDVAPARPASMRQAVS